MLKKKVKKEGTNGCKAKQWILGAYGPIWVGFEGSESKTKIIHGYLGTLCQGSLVVC